MSEDSWEEFDRGAAPVTGHPVVAIQNRGTFGWNRAAWEAAGKPELVRLFFNRQANAIGFKPAQSDDPRAYPVRRQSRSDNYQISGKKFLQSYGVPIKDYARRFPARVEGGMLIVDLDRDTEAVSNGEE